MHWTPEQILALAPDPNSAKRGQALATTNKWLSLETDGNRVVWGKCKSSGTAHYDTIIDLKGPAFKCSCPSRKFPCKHSIALLLLSTSETDGFKLAGDIPENVDNWIAKRDAKTSKPISDKSDEEIQKAAARKAKTYQDRLVTMTGGIKDLENWLYDLIRLGLASTEGASTDMVSTKFSKGNAVLLESTDVWSGIAKRMVDAKLGGVGRKIRELSLIQGRGKDWHEKMLEELSDIFLLIQGFQKLEDLPSELQIDLLRICGVNTKKDELLAQKGIEDEWMVVGQFENTNIDNATMRRTWFLGQESGKFALILEYDYINAGFPFPWPKGRIFKGEMLFYPAVFPLRGMMRSHEITEHSVDGWGGHESISEFLNEYAQALAQNPWIEDYPVALTNVFPSMEYGELFLMDKEGNAVPILDKNRDKWKIMALSGGVALDVFGEWTGSSLHVLSVVANYRFVGL